MCLWVDADFDSVIRKQQELAEFGHPHCHSRLLGKGYGVHQLFDGPDIAEIASGEQYQLTQWYYSQNLKHNNDKLASKIIKIM